MVQQMNIVGKITCKEYTDECPDHCRWKGTDVLHGGHTKNVVRDIMMLKDACERLGINVKMSSYDETRMVAFDDSVHKNHYCGGEVVHGMMCVKKYHNAWEPSGQYGCISKDENGKLSWGISQ